MPTNPYEAAVRFRLPNGRPTSAKTASTSAVQGRNHIVAPNVLADVFLSATCPDARRANLGLLASVSARPPNAPVPVLAGIESDGLIEASDCCAITGKALPAIIADNKTLLRR